MYTKSKLQCTIYIKRFPKELLLILIYPYNLNNAQMQAVKSVDFKTF